MKRTIQFQILDDKYSFIENDETIFEISKNSLQLDVKGFYSAFFANGKDYSELEINPPFEMEKEDKRIYETISQLIENICMRLKTELLNNTESILDEKSIEAYKMPN